MEYIKTEKKEKYGIKYVMKIVSSLTKWILKRFSDKNWCITVWVQMGYWRREKGRATVDLNAVKNRIKNMLFKIILEWKWIKAINWKDFYFE